MSKTLHVMAVLLTLLITAIGAMLMLFTTADSYSTALDAYPHQSHKFILANTNNEKANQALATAAQYLEEHHGTLVRKDISTSDESGQVAATYIGIMGDVKANARALSFSYLGTPVLNEANLTQLIHSDKGKTLGLDMATTDMLAPLPTFRGMNKLVVEKLPDLVQQSGTPQGYYDIVGITQDQYSQLIKQAAQASGITEVTLQGEESGRYSMEGFLPLVLLAALVACTVLLTVLLVIGTFQSLRNLGMYLLLGWTRLKYLLRNVIPVIITGITGYLLLAGVAFAYFAEGFSFTWQALGAIFASFLLVLLGIATAVGAAALVILSVKPMNAIRGNISKKGLLIVLAVIYTLGIGSIIGALYAIDGPLRTYMVNEQIRHNWAQVSDYRIPYTQKTGNDQVSFQQQSLKYDQDFYRWYQSIDGKPGVYFIHTMYNSQKLLDEFRNDHTFQHVPLHAYWEFAASANYLRDHGFSVSDDLTTLSNQGTRVYLIPDTYTSAEQTAMKNYLTEEQTGHAKGSEGFENVFTQHPRFEFRLYHPSVALFNWSTDPTMPTETKDPVIYLANSHTMTYVESDSLRAAGAIGSSTVTLTPEAANRYLSKQYLAGYELDDNMPVFLPVREFIAGLQKSQEALMQLFGIVILIITLLVLGLLAAISMMYQSIYRETVAIKRLLGYPLMSIFLPIYLTVIGVNTLALIVALVLRSNFMPLYMGSVFALQLILLTSYTIHSSRGLISRMIKTL